MGTITSSQRHKAATSLNRRQELLQALIKLRSPARSSWFPLRGRGARVDPESLKEGSDEVLLRFTDREGVKREVGVQVTVERGQGIKEVLEGMGQSALRELGVPRHPRIDHYAPPRLSTAIPVALAIAFQAYVVFSPDPGPRDAGRHRSLGTAVKAWLERLPHGEWILPMSVVVLVVAHAIEAAYMDSLARKHRVPRSPRLAWDLTTLMFGFPSLDRFASEVRREKVRLIAAAAR